MDWRRVVGPRGLCRPLDEKQRFPTNSQFLVPAGRQAGQQGSKTQHSMARQGRQEGRRAGGQEGRRAGGQEGRRAGGQEGRRAGGQKAGGQEGRRAGGQEGRRAGGQEGRRAGGQEGRRGQAGRRAGEARQAEGPNCQFGASDARFALPSLAVLTGPSAWGLSRSLERPRK